MQKTSVKGYHLSRQQAHLWAQQGESQIWYSYCAAWLSGNVDMQSLLSALQKLVQRHTILRTAFRRIPGMEIPVQVIRSELEIDCSVIDLQQLSAPEQNISLNEHLTHLQDKVTNLETPLFASELLHLSTEKHLLLLRLPTLCADEYTLMHIILELSQLYAGSFREIERDEEPLQYAEVAAWQEQIQQSEEAETLHAYWRQFDLSQLAAIRLPFEQPGSVSHAYVNAEGSEQLAISTHEVVLDLRTAKQIQQKAAQYAISLEAWLLACWELVLWRLNGRQDSLIGVACNGRSYEGLTEELAEALGLYTRIVPFEMRFVGGQPFEQVARLVNKNLLEATKRQSYFLWADSSTSSDIGNGGSLAHFFPLSFEYIAWPDRTTSDNIKISLYKSSCHLEKFLLKLHAVQIGEQLHLRFQYNPQSMKINAVEQIAVSFQTLLHHALAQPQAAVGTLSLLSSEDQASLLTLSRGTIQSIPALGLHRLFEAQVRLRPRSVAAMSLQGQLTYHQLNEQANRLAQVLRGRGIGPGAVVGLCLPRQAGMLVGLLGILKAGGAYLPLDAGSPAPRLIYQLDESKATLLLTQEGVGVRPQLAAWSGSILCLEELEEELSQASPENREAGSTGEDLAYIIYTSGSTGVPKGVMVQHRSVVNYTQAMCERLGVEPDWQFATVSTLAADLGNTAIFCALASGGCIQVLDYEQVTSGEAMATWAKQHPIDVLKIVPSHLSALLESEHAQALLPRQALVLGGEALSVPLIERVRQNGGVCQIYNHYGPTEATIGVLVNPVEMKGPGAMTSVALGRPLANTQMYVLDQQMQLVPSGGVGELYIGGACLALGYQQQAAQTAERFVPHCYSHQPGERLYRTGDLVYYGEDGKIVFVGRRDGQVKLRGYRIEVREIEAVLRQHPLVWDCAVQLQEQGSGVPRLIGYVVPRTTAGLSVQSLREALQDKLPEYMLPSGFVILEKLPLTANGKLDRQRLSQLELVQEGEPEVQGEPRSPIEEMLVQMWKELLLVPVVGVDDNFFALGGHSLLATRVMARLQAMFQIVLSVQVLFEAPTVANLAQRIEQVLRKNDGIEAPPLRAVAHTEDIPLSFAQQRLWFLDQLESGSTAYLVPRALCFSGNLSIKALEWSLENIVRRHESLRTTFEKRAGQPVQIIHPASRIALPLIDLRGLQSAQREVVTRHLIDQEAQHPCDLAQGPMLRTYLLRLEEKEHISLFTLHHIVTDNWSIQILIRELTTLYQASIAGQPALLVPLLIQYADYALWQRQWLQGAVLEQLIHYWQQQLSAPLPVLNLPTDYPRDAQRAVQGGMSFLKLSTTVSSGLNVLAQQENVTLFMVLLATFTVLLNYHTDQDDLVVGTDIANRNRIETEGLIGFFVNQLVLRIDLAHNPSFLEIVRRVRNVSLKAYTHQDLPFDRLVEALNPERDLSRTPLFQAKFVLQNIPEQQISLSDIKLQMIELEQGTPKFDLLLNMTENGHELLGWLEYRADLFKPETMNRFIQHFEAIITHAIAHPETPLDELKVMLAISDRAERHTREQELQQVGLQKLQQIKRKRDK